MTSVSFQELQCPSKLIQQLKLLIKNMEMLIKKHKNTAQD